MNVASSAPLLALALASTCHAQPVPDFGLDWRTIGAPGNRSTIPSEVPMWAELEAGGVGYEYRLMRTEITTAQYYEFLTAYLPFSGGLSGAIGNTGLWIYHDGVGGFHMFPGTEHWPATASWRMGARMANWLHNGKVNEAWAFETGAYDTSTFTQNPDGTYNDAPHLPGATIWIPSADELVKGHYYDPNRYGEGQGGYWLYPNGTDEPLLAGLPENGGQTNAQPFVFPPEMRHMNVGSYPSVQSPWGLLDGSGGEREWTETWRPLDNDRWQIGSRFGSVGALEDRLDYRLGWDPASQIGGFRFASIIPASGSLWVLALTGFALRRTRS